MTIGIDHLVVVEVVIIPHRLGVVVAKTEAVDVRAQAVDVVVWHHIGLELKELILKYDLVTVGIEDDLASAPAADTELEARVVTPLESEIAFEHARAKLLARQRRQIG